jgi:hypothetical protein
MGRCTQEDCAVSWLARRDRERFTGWIAGLGTASGHRVVVGHWHGSPYGAVSDAMVEDPAGHRTLYAPTSEPAEFLAAACRFHDVRAQRLPLAGLRAPRRERISSNKCC